MTGDRASCRPYAAYKDSCVWWLGQVPAHWEILRLKAWLDVNQMVLPEDTDPDYTFDYVDIGSVATGRLSARPERIRFGDSPSRARRVVRPGDTLVSTVRTYLKAVWHAEHSGADLIASTGFAVLTPRRGTFPKFMSYFFRSDPFTERVAAESVGIAYPAIAETRLGALEVCVPPLSEQVAIVRFLDHADRRIQRYIRAKKKLIVLLEEQKQAPHPRCRHRGDRCADWATISVLQGLGHQVVGNGSCALASTRSKVVLPGVRRPFGYRFRGTLVCVTHYRRDTAHR